MARARWIPLLVVMVGALLILGVEHQDAQYQKQAQIRTMQSELADLQEGLEQIFQEVVASTKLLAAQISAHPDVLDSLKTSNLMAEFQPSPAVFSTSFTRYLKIFYAHPPMGNESIVGLDYTRRIQFAAAVRQVMEEGATLIEGPITLQQTDQPGLIVRTPFYDEKGEFLGIVNSSIDMAELFELVGFREHEARFELLIRDHHKDQMKHNIKGSGEAFNQAKQGFLVTLVNDHFWELRGKPIFDETALDRRTDTIRLTGMAILLGLLYLIMRRERPWRELAGPGRGISLYLILIVAMLIPMIMLIAVFVGVSYYKIQQASERLVQQQAAETAAQLSGNLRALFDMPRQAVSNAELFRQGVLNVDDTHAVLSVFLSQLRVQPYLTFLALGTAEGEFHAASRPTMGRDRSLRIHSVTPQNDFEMRVHWVDDANQPSQAWQKGTKKFHAHEYEWYRMAQSSGHAQWYPIHEYATNDERGQYRGYGIGMSVPVLDGHGRFAGVMAADISLAQISEFLRTKMNKSDGAAFLLSTDGQLIASSQDGPESFIDRMQSSRVLARESHNSVIHQAGTIIDQAHQTSGNRSFSFARQYHDLNWQTLNLPDGPALTLGVVLSRSWTTAFNQQALKQILYLSVLFLVLAALMALRLAYWLTQSLRGLDAWARKLDAGGPYTTHTPTTPIREVSTLLNTLNSMAKRLGNYTAELERRVAERTLELTQSNEKLAALSLTDPLTGIANRRRFDQVLLTEWDRACRHSQKLGLLLVDIDYFKNYNDHYGHGNGDTTLRKVSKAIAGQVDRSTDLVARYGGEEFVVVMPGCTLASAMRKAEKIRQDVMALNIAHSCSATGIVTVSIGVVVGQGRAHADVNVLFQHVDEALYKAKNAGRNQVRTVVLSDLSVLH